MQNTIKIDVSTDTILSISTVDNGSNSIAITFTNCTVNDTPPEVEFYKPEKYCGCVTFDTSQQEYTTTVPDECVGDGHVFHFRYVCKDKAHKYFHIIGDATKFINMKLEQIANDVMKMVGVMKVNTEPEPGKYGNIVHEPFVLLKNTDSRIDLISKVQLAETVELDQLVLDIEFDGIVREDDTSFAITGDFSALAENMKVSISSKEGFLFDPELRSEGSFTLGKVVRVNKIYEIPEPTNTNIYGSGWTGITLYHDTQYGRDFGIMKSSTYDQAGVPWWAIGFIANVNGVARPIVITTVEEGIYTICDRYYLRQGEAATLTYRGETYWYTTENMYAVGFDTNCMQDNIVPIHSEEIFSDYESAAIKLLNLYFKS